MRLAVIGGTGVGPRDLFDSTQQVQVATPYGSVELHKAVYENEPVFFLLRHGSGHSVPPHQVNYRANIWALKEADVEGVIATAAVGGLHSELRPGELVAISSFMDFTSGRPTTFFDGENDAVVHTDMTEPYCPALRRLLVATGRNLKLNIRDRGCYVCTNGPRYETAAEVAAFALLGGDVVGMTGVPEVVLARELGLCYATVALVTNPGAGLASERLSHGQVTEVMRSSSVALCRLLQNVVSSAQSLTCHSC